MSDMPKEIWARKPSVHVVTGVDFLMGVYTTEEIKDCEHTKYIRDDLCTPNTDALEALAEIKICLDALLKETNRGWSDRARDNFETIRKALGGKDD